MANNIAEELFKSVDILVDSKLKNISFDKTVKCYITDVSEAENGCYRVSDGSSEFEAYTKDTSLKLGEDVYVMVPQGDYDSQKIIVSKIAIENKEAITWVSPSDSYIPIDDIYSMESEVGILANGGIAAKTLPLSSQFERKTGFNKLCIAADFRSWLKPLNVISGSYGLRIVFQLAGVDNTKTVYFTSEEMWGNPYNYEGYYTQEKVIDISAWGDIDAVASVELFQGPQNDGTDKRIFLDVNEELVPHQLTIGELEPIDMPDNIFVNNISISVGYSMEEIGEDTLFLFSDGSLSYSPEKNSNDNDRLLKARWVHKDGSAFRCIDSVDELNGKIYWFKYDVNSLDKKHPLMAVPGWVEIEGENDFSYFIQELNYEKAEEKYRAAIEYTDVVGTKQVIRSEELIFTNEREITYHDAGVYELLFEYDDVPGSSQKTLNGKYFLYNETGGLINTDDAIRVRKLTVKTHPNAPIDGDGNQVLTWTFPSQENTMIDFMGKTANDYKDVYTIEYRIKENYLNGMDNTISCKIVRTQGYEFNGSTTMEFGQTDICGTGLYAQPVIYNSKNLAVPAVLNGSSDNYVLIVPANEKLERIALSDDQASLKDWNDASASGDVKFGDYIAWKYPIPSDKFGKILVVEGTFNGKRFKINIPIPTRTSEDIILSGAKSVSYPISGTSPSYDKSEYLLIKSDGTKIVPSLCKLSGGDYATNPKTYYPQLVAGDERAYQFTNTRCVLEPKQLFMSGLKNDVVITVQGGGYTYVQPINIEIYRYGNSFVNNWDGNLTIDEKNGIILSTMVGAGHKESDNSFSGVLMGDVQIDSSTDETGLYGYHYGQQSFAFKEDGTAFIGKSGRGRIIMNGNSGSIESMSYAANDKGMKIDLDDGFIDIRGATATANPDNKDDYTTTGARVHIDVKSPYLSINTDTTNHNGKEIMHVGTDAYFLQSDNYTTSTGSKFDLVKGELVMHSTGNNKGYVRLSGTDNPFFRVNNGTKDLMICGDTEYKLESNNFKSDGTEGIQINLVEGSLTSRQGTIGGWTIANDSLSKPFVYNNETKYAIMRAPGAATADTTAIAFGAAGKGNNASDYNTAPFRVTYGGSVYASNLAITGGSITLGNNFSVDSDGNLTAKDVNISGDMDITSGSIKIGSKFSVDNDGNMTASNADITGKITATSGSISNLNIGSGMTLGGSAVSKQSLTFLTGIELSISRTNVEVIGSMWGSTKKVQTSLTSTDYVVSGVTGSVKYCKIPSIFNITQKRMTITTLCASSGATDSIVTQNFGSSSENTGTFDVIGEG